MDCIFTLHLAPQLHHQSCFLGRSCFFLLFAGLGAPCEVKGMGLGPWCLPLFEEEDAAGLFHPRNFAPSCRLSARSSSGSPRAPSDISPACSSSWSLTSVFLLLELLTWTSSHPALLQQVHPDQVVRGDRARGFNGRDSGPGS